MGRWHNKRIPVYITIVLAFACLVFYFWKTRENGAANPVPPGEGNPAAAADRSEGPKPPPGRWRKFRDPAKTETLTEAQREAIKKLQAIGYVSGSQPPKATQMINVHKSGLTSPGYNLFTSGHFPGAILMDINGRQVHTWQCERESIWAELDPGLEFATSDYWRRVYLFENGDILGIFEGIGIFKLDVNSKVIWGNQNGAHHDLDVLPGGDIYVLTRAARMIPRLNEDEPILEDFISILDAAGHEKRRISLIDCFENSPEYGLGKGPWVGDIFHTNTVRVIREDSPAGPAWLKKGHVIISIRNISVMAVVDIGRERIIKAWNGRQLGFKRQHDPRLLPDGTMLFFNNMSGEDRSSAVVVDPVSFETRWSYDGTDIDPLYSPTMSTASLLPNGNYLITESDNGRALEVTPAKEVVWEFYNPYRIGPKGEYIATVLEMMRIPEAYVAGWLAR